MQLQLFDYNGNNVSFRKENEHVFVNATEMAKPFLKRPVDYLQNQQTIDFIEELSKVRKSTLADLVRVTKGGNNPGTWMHEDVALEFARWLNPAFAIWCNDRIKELVKFGITATPQTLENIANNPDLLIQLATALKTERANKEILERKAFLQEQELTKQAPKVEYYNEVLQSQSTYNINQIAKELGTSAVTLNKFLADKKIQYKQNDTWLLYHKYQNKGYTKTKTHSFTDTEGKKRTSMLTVWTEIGRLFIHEKYEEHTNKLSNFLIKN